MHVVRERQLQLLQQALPSIITPVLIQHARTYHAERSAALGEQGLEKRVAEVLDAAREYHVDAGLRTMARLLDLAFVLGFPLPEPIDATLRDRSLPSPEARLERAWKRALFALEAR